MKESFLHYVWYYKKFDFSNLQTEQGEELEILNCGHYTQQSGPDFFNGQIVLNKQKWAGNIEIHVKASDWYVHNHHNDYNYDSVILHVVWEYDMPVIRKDTTEISVLVLSKYVKPDLLRRYDLLFKEKQWLLCENYINKMDSFKMYKWIETLYFERLEQRIKPINKLRVDTVNDWEKVFFCFLAKGFGLNVNGSVFFDMAKNLPIKAIQKERFSVLNLESIFFGSLGILRRNCEDTYSRNLIEAWYFLSHKYGINASKSISVQYFKLRPDNFPTIRLSQLAQLFHINPALFEMIICAKTKYDYYKIFNVSTSEYWENHYVLDKQSVFKTKKTSRSFIDLLVINTVIPLKYAYYQSRGEDCSDDIIELISSLKPESNKIIKYFLKLGVPVENSFDSQSLLQLKKEYCDAKRCLNCTIGKEFLYNADID